MPEGRTPAFGKPSILRASILLSFTAISVTGCIPPPRAERPRPIYRPAPTPQPAPPQQMPAYQPPAQPYSPPPSALPPPAEPAPEIAEDPSAPPAWVARPVLADAETIAPQTYRVVRGDTLRSIANRTRSSSELIAIRNKLSHPFVVKVGQRLKIPGGRFHLVRRAQSGIAIARAYGVEWSQIVDLNYLTEPFILREGMRLLLPSEREVAQMSMEQRASAFQLDIDDILTGGEPALAEQARPATPVSSPTRTLPSSAAIGEPGGKFTGRIVWPVDGKVVRRFGAIGSGQKNDGINIAVPIGTPILAAAAGTVAYVGNDIAIYGGLILIRHADGWLTAYGFADRLEVKRGQAVQSGQRIALVGVPGATMSEPQLHFQLRKGRKPVNPIDYLSQRN